MKSAQGRDLGVVLFLADCIEIYERLDSLNRQLLTVLQSAPELKRWIDLTYLEE